MKKFLFFIFLLITPLLLWAQSTSILSAGNWNNSDIWSGGNIGDDITESVVFDNAIGTVTIQNGDSYVTSYLDMNNGNTLTIDDGGSLLIGSAVDAQSLFGLTNSTLNIHGNLVVWGVLDLKNSAIINITGNLIVYGDLLLQNDAVINVSGDVIVGGSLNAANTTDITVEGSLTIAGDGIVGDFSSLSGSGNVSIVGTCTGPESFCQGGSLDTTPPVISGCPENVIGSNTDGMCDAIVNWLEPSADDNVLVDSFTSSHSSGDTFPVGITTVTYTARDLEGNQATCSFTVTVNDITAPVISACPADIKVDLTSAGCDAVVNWTAPTAADNCTIDSFTSSHLSGDTFPIGVTTVTYTARDLAGNEATCSFTITVDDTVAPFFELCSTSVIVEEFDVVNQVSVVTWIEPLASDNCGAPIISSNFNSGDSFPRGTTKIIYTATDNTGNTAVCEFEFTVEGNRAPTGESIRTEAYSGEPTEICLAVSDFDNDELSITEVNYTTLNGTIEVLQRKSALCLLYTSFDDFEGEELFTVTVCDNGSPSACTDIKVLISVSFDLRLTAYKALTPNNDNINDDWLIENIENYTNNHVTIYDRNGGMIYSVKGYNNNDMVWRGESNQNGRQTLPSGTYFYKIDLGDNLNVLNGYVELIR